MPHQQGSYNSSSLLNSDYPNLRINHRGAAYRPIHKLLSMGNWSTSWLLTEKPRGAPQQVFPDENSQTHKGQQN